MPLVQGHDLLAAAERGSFAIPGFNVSNLEMAQGVIAGAEARRAPIFLQFNSSNLKHIGGIELAAMIARALAARAAVPVAVHLDHGVSPAQVREARNAGFTSLMFDGSTYPFERNLRETMEAYAVAAEARVALEAELGHVGGREPGVVTSEMVLTDPEMAARFVEDTRVDSLAVSVGTAHGMAGSVNVALVRELRVATRGKPLVLHGGSGVTRRDLELAIAAGIRKVNISTEIHAAFLRAMVEATGKDPRPALAAGREAVAEAAVERIDVLGAAYQG